MSLGLLVSLPVCPSRLPFDRLRYLIDAFFQPHAAERLTGDKFIPFVVTILAANLQRIHLQRRGDDIHLRLDSPGGLRNAEAAKGSRRRLVGVNGIGVYFKIRNAIRPGCGVTRLFRHPRADLGVAAGVEMDLAFSRHQCSVFLHAGFHSDHRCMLGDGIKNFLARKQHAHRPLRLYSKSHGDRFDLRINLPAVAATEVGDDDADF